MDTHTAQDSINKKCLYSKWLRISQTLYAYLDHHCYESTVSR